MALAIQAPLHVRHPERGWCNEKGECFNMPKCGCSNGLSGCGCKYGLGEFADGPANISWHASSTLGAIAGALFVWWWKSRE